MHEEGDHDDSKDRESDPTEGDNSIQDVRLLAEASEGAVWPFVLLILVKTLSIVAREGYLRWQQHRPQAKRSKPPKDQPSRCEEERNP